MALAIHNADQQYRASYRLFSVQVRQGVYFTIVGAGREGEHFSRV